MILTVLTPSRGTVTWKVFCMHSTGTTPSSKPGRHFIQVSLTAMTTLQICFCPMNGYGHLGTLTDDLSPHLRNLYLHIYSDIGDIDVYEECNVYLTTLDVWETNLSPNSAHRIVLIRLQYHEMSCSWKHYIVCFSVRRLGRGPQGVFPSRSNCTSHNPEAYFST